MNRSFWSGRRVFLTGHTGFKGTWLTRWLTMLGARVTGYSLDVGRASARPVGLKPDLSSDDVRDLQRLRGAMQAAEPEIVMHLAAQALVRTSYEEPVTTFATNTIGTVNVLESIRTTPAVRVAVMVTSDKCYANAGLPHAFREDDRLGGPDPYSASKASAELAIDAYRCSFFAAPGAPRIVSVRAGNVIGGGDWSPHRLVPDLVRAFRAAAPARIRYPHATRPWQFVLDALHGYATVAEQAFERRGLPDAFNFGPAESEARTVGWLADTMAARWGGGASWFQPDEQHPHEAPMLALDSARARQFLGWKPLLDIETAVQWTADWYKSDRNLTGQQIERFMELASA